MSTKRKNVMVIFGTRPEAIKMAPVIQLMKQHRDLHPQIVVTGQHKEMLNQVLELFQISPDLDLQIMREAQTLNDITSRVISSLPSVFARFQPDAVLVHGDTSSTLAAALAAFYAGIPVGHVEAGLRTGNMHAPWPEEMNRRLTAPLSTWHFAPTAAARDNLLREGVSDSSIHVTGNTVIDALIQVDRKLTLDAQLRSEMLSRFPFLLSNKRLVLVTGHRRENFGAGFERICRALACLAARHDIQIVYPVHLNPYIQNVIRTNLSGQSNVHLIPPQDYLPFVFLMQQAHLILTDSGGVQEEAPSLGKPVLVMRETTERPEAVSAGTVQLVGTDETSIVRSVLELLDNPDAYARMSEAHNPYGDGEAAARICAALLDR